MKSKLKTVAAVTATHLLLFWFAVGIVKASGFTLFSLFGPLPQYSPAQEFLFDVVGVLSLPMAWLADLLSVQNLFAMICALTFNSVIWGTCIGLLLYGFRQRHQRPAA